MSGVTTEHQTQQVRCGNCDGIGDGGPEVALRQPYHACRW